MLRFAENLKYYRKSIGVTQSKFAEILNEKLVEMGLTIDYNNKSISMWEKGDRFPDSPLVWIALANIMNVSLDDMMKSDISTLNSTTSQEIIDNENELQFELCQSYLRSHCEGEYKDINLKKLYLNIDEHISGDMYHGMFYVLTSVKSPTGYFRKYNIVDVKNTNYYINNLSKKYFCEERYFVRDIIDNGGRDVIVTSDQISEVWEGYFECLGNIEEYNTISVYDDDKNHILTMVEYNIHLNKDILAKYLNVAPINLAKEISQTILNNKKFHLGIRWAKELIRKSY